MVNHPASYNRSEALMRLTEADVRRKGEQTGSVRCRSGSWYIRFHQWCYQDGKYVWKEVERKIDPKGRVLDEKKAELFGYEQFVKGANELNKAPMGQMSVEFFFSNHFEETVTGTYKLGWKENTKSIWNAHVCPAFGHMELKDVRRPMVQLWATAKSGEGYAPQTVKHMVNLVKDIFAHAIRMEFSDRANPGQEIILPELNHKKRKAYSIEQLGKLADAVRANGKFEYARMVDFVAKSGVRIGELIGLRRGSVDFEGMCFTVRENVYRGRRQTAKTDGSVRVIPLTKESAHILQVQMAMSKYKGADDPVFPSREGGPLNPGNILRRHVKPVAVKLGMPEFDWHSERHSCASSLDPHATEAEKMEMLGHTTEEMSIRYTHAEMDAKRDALEKATARKLKK